MSDYERIARIIRHLQEHYTAQPSLSALASLVGLSESHLHRLFHEWAGVTPKDFLQCLTLERLKRQLQDSKSILEASLGAGLSGPGRAHDLCVSLESVSPGELKLGGRGLRIEWGVAETPFGYCSLGWTDRGICHLVFHPSQQVAGENAPPHLEWPNAELIRSDGEAKRMAETVFRPSASRSSRLAAFVRGTPFQVRVWRALLQIPEGALASYGDLAHALGDLKLARAVGTACGSNTVGYLIPCHRVIRETGVITGYRWGAERKLAMVAWEVARRGSL